jgi:hypothetical protein
MQMTASAAPTSYSRPGWPCAGACRTCFNAGTRALSPPEPTAARPSRGLFHVRTASTLYQMINFHRDQADVIRKVFGHGEALDFIDQLLTKFLRAKACPLAHGPQ